MTFCNPDFDPLTNEADLALVGLQEPVQFGKRVGLACLPREGAALQMRDALMVQTQNQSKNNLKTFYSVRHTNSGGLGSELK